MPGFMQTRIRAARRDYSAPLGRRLQELPNLVVEGVMLGGGGVLLESLDPVQGAGRVAAGDLQQGGPC